jgi:hypothetical protein
MRQIIRNRKASNGWQGYEPEQYWAIYVERAIKNKWKRLKGFSLYHENWLAIYENAPLFSAQIDLDKATALLIQRISAVWRERPRFDRVFIETGRSIVRLSPASHDIIEVNDLWPLPIRRPI